MVRCFSLFTATPSTLNLLSAVLLCSYRRLPRTGLAVGVAESGVLYTPDLRGCYVTLQSIRPASHQQGPPLPHILNNNCVYQNLVNPRTSLSCFSFAFPWITREVQPLVMCSMPFELYELSVQTLWPCICKVVFFSLVLINPSYILNPLPRYHVVGYIRYQSQIFPTSLLVVFTYF